MNGTQSSPSSKATEVSQEKSKREKVIAKMSIKDVTRFVFKCVCLCVCVYIYIYIYIYIHTYMYSYIQRVGKARRCCRRNHEGKMIAKVSIIKDFTMCLTLLHACVWTCLRVHTSCKFLESLMTCVHAYPNTYVSR